jgi:hypothetical protein
MQKTKTAPRIGDKSAEFYTGHFSSLNAGMEYTADAFPALYRRTMHALRGRFSRGELMLMLDVFNATALTPGIAGQQIDANVADGIAMDRLDEKWEIDGNALNLKIRGLTFFESACLEIWSNGFWYGKRHGELDAEAWIAPMVEG